MENKEFCSESQHDRFLRLLSSEEAREVGDMTQKFYEIWTALPAGEKAAMKTYLVDNMPEYYNFLIDSLFDAFTIWDDIQKSGTRRFSCIMNTVENGEPMSVLRDFMTLMTSTWNRISRNFPQGSTPKDEEAKDEAGSEKDHQSGKKQE